MQDFSDNPNNQPVAPSFKKPSGSVRSWSIEDVKQALRRKLLAAEQEPDPEKQAELLRKAWPLIRTIRRHGWSLPAYTVACAGLTMSATAILLYLWLSPKTEWRVIEQTDSKGYEFVLQRVVNGHPLIPELRRFCAYEIRPRIEQGMTLQSLRFEERGDCISIQADDLGYVIERLPNHKPKLARNCYSPADDVPNVCLGTPQF